MYDVRSNLTNDYCANRNTFNKNTGSYSSPENYGSPGSYSSEDDSYAVPEGPKGNYEGLLSMMNQHNLFGGKSQWQD